MCRLPKLLLAPGVYMVQVIAWYRCVHGPGPGYYLTQMCTWHMWLFVPGCCSQPRLMLSPDVNMVHIAHVSVWSICVHGPDYYLVQVCIWSSYYLIQVCTLPRLLLGPYVYMVQVISWSRCVHCLVQVSMCTWSRLLVGNNQMYLCSRLLLGQHVCMAHVITDHYLVHMCTCPKLLLDRDVCLVQMCTWPRLLLGNIIWFWYDAWCRFSFGLVCALCWQVS